MSSERFLVTGALGCIGAWVIRQLIHEGVEVVAADQSTDQKRLRLILEDDELTAVRFRQLDITDKEGTIRLVLEQEVTHVIHLAGLQVPFCKANPTLGAAVNVAGTINIFEAVRVAGDQVTGLAYASSIAVFGSPNLYPPGPLRDDVVLAPATLYGVYKVANEQSARVYWEDWGIGSVGLRPYIVYGVARDQGMTSDLTKATLAAAANRPYEIKFDGPTTVHYTADVAGAFIAAARAGHQGSTACNLGGSVIEVKEFVSTLEQLVPHGKVSHTEGHRLPFPHQIDDSLLRSIAGKITVTPLQQAVEQTLEHFQRLVAEGRVDLAQLDQ